MLLVRMMMVPFTWRGWKVLHFIVEVCETTIGSKIFTTLGSLAKLIYLYRCQSLIKLNLWCLFLSTFSVQLQHFMCIDFYIVRLLWICLWQRNYTVLLAFGLYINGEVSLLFSFKGKVKGTSNLFEMCNIQVLLLIG